jgi:hypothetical protein
MATDANIIWQKILEAKQMRMTIREETWPYMDCPGIFFCYQ